MIETRRLKSVVIFVQTIIDYYSPKYENLILIGDFNRSTEIEHLDALIQAYNLNNLINKPTYF